MRFKVHGLSLSTGKESTFEIEAPTPSAAEEKAREMGIAVSQIDAILGEPPTPPQATKLPSGIGPIGVAAGIIIAFVVIAMCPCASFWGLKSATNPGPARRTPSSVGGSGLRLEAKPGKATFVRVDAEPLFPELLKRIGPDGGTLVIGRRITSVRMQEKSHNSIAPIIWWVGYYVYFENTTGKEMLGGVRGCLLDADGRTVACEEKFTRLRIPPGKSEWFGYIDLPSEHTRYSKIVLEAW